MERKMMIIAMVLLLSGCASAPQGRSIDVEAEHKTAASLEGCPTAWKNLMPSKCKFYKDIIRPVNPLDIIRGNNQEGEQK